MSYVLDKGSHSIYSLHYHFMQVVNYREKALTDDIIVDFFESKVRRIADTLDVEILKIECDKDYFRMLFRASPLLNIPQFVNAVKTIMSRKTQRRFPDVKKEVWRRKFWSSSYFLATSGQVTLDVLKRYLDSQEINRFEGM